MSIEYLGTASRSTVVAPTSSSRTTSRRSPSRKAATGERPFVEWWMHAGMLRFADEKMSKSLGNLVLVRDLLASYPGDAIRHYLISHHYRDEIAYDESGVEASALATARLRQACRVAEEIEPLAPALADPATLDPLVAGHRERFLAAMDDDLDTPAALPELHALAAIGLSEVDPALRAQAGWMVRELGARILGLRLATVPSVAETSPIDQAVPRDSAARAAARAGGRCRGRGRQLVPVSVRLGNVVPPEDPEDWTQPLTWVAAAGMLAAPTSDLAVVLAGATRVGDADARHLPGSGHSGSWRRPDGRHAAGLAESVNRDRGCRLVRRPGHRAGRSIDGRRAADRRRLTNGGPGIRGVGGRPGGRRWWQPRWPPCLRPTADGGRDSLIPGAASVGASWLVLLGVFGAVA